MINAKQDASSEARERVKASASVRRPQKHLDTELYPPNYRFGDPPLLHYGLPVQPQDLRAYARRNDVPDLLDELEPVDLDDTNHLLCSVAHFLSDLCRVRLTGQMVLGENGDAAWLISLRNNYDIKIKRYKREHEDILFDYLRKVLNISADQRPMWWWNFHFGFPYLCPIPLYNPGRRRYGLQACKPLICLPEFIDNDYETEWSDVSDEESEPDSESEPTTVSSK